MGGASRYPWSKCIHCKACEYNSNLMANNKKCLSCGKQVELYDPSQQRGSSVDRRVSFDGDAVLIDDHGSDQATPCQGARYRSPGRRRAKGQAAKKLDGLLAKAAEHSDDPVMKAVLAEQRSMLKGQAA
eukprot:2608469-Pyramimonas_sp.AAC.1